MTRHLIYICMLFPKKKTKANCHKKDNYSLCNSSIDCSIAVVDEKLTEWKHVFIVEDNTQDFMYKTNN